MNQDATFFWFMSGLMVFQQLYWMWINQRLVDKLMSRNYAEYVQVQNLSKTSQDSHSQSKEAIEVEDPMLKELNGLLGG